MIKVVNGQKVKDGAGVLLNRLIGTSNLDDANPFYLLDEFRSEDKADYMAGFPMHPHRGIETITYMVKGSFRHRDSKGNEGVLNAGDVQWMTSGKGILHEEMPIMKDGELWGYQLWINLPKELKMQEPKYRHISSEIIPIFQEGDVAVKVISGDYKNTKGVVETFQEINYFDVNMKQGKFVKEVSGATLIYVHTGEVQVSLNDDSIVKVKKGDMAVINDEEVIEVNSSETAGFLFINSNPINEPVAKYGPFIMNTMDEILQTIDDFNFGNF